MKPKMTGQAYLNVKRYGQNKSAQTQEAMPTKGLLTRPTNAKIEKDEPDAVRLHNFVMKSLNNA